MIPKSRDINRTVPITSIINPDSISPKVPKAAGTRLSKKGNMLGASINTEAIDSEDPMGTASIAIEAARQSREDSLNAEQQAVRETLRAQQLAKAATQFDIAAGKLSGLASEEQKVFATLEQVEKTKEEIARELQEKIDMLDSQVEEASAYDEY
jgi:hypothetical protein